MGRRRGRPWLVLLVALASISTAAPLARLAGVDGFTAAWWRLLVGSLATLALALASGGAAGASPVPAWLLAASGALLALHFGLWLESLRYASVAASTGIVVSYPVMVALVEELAERRRGTGGCPSRLLGALLAFAGVAVLSTPWSGATPMGAALSLAAAAAAAGYFLIGRAARARGLGTLAYTLRVYTAAVLVETLYALLLGVEPWRAPARSIPYLLALGIVPMLGGHTMLNYALAYLPASTVTTVALLEPYGASVLAWLLLGEEPPAAALPGIALSVTGAWLSMSGCRG